MLRLRLVWQSLRLAMFGLHDLATKELYHKNKTRLDFVAAGVFSALKGWLKPWVF